MPGGWRMLGWVSASCLVILIVHLTGTPQWSLTSSVRKSSIGSMMIYLLR